MFLMELLFANCMNVIPEAAASRKRKEGREFSIKETKEHRKQNLSRLQSHSPTMPNKMQYMAANIGNGIEAKKAPNFPERMQCNRVK
ncbi:hypothetical protein GQ457_03G039250 [Hibiscus cannabinus]